VQGSKRIGLFFAESLSLTAKLLKIYGKNYHDNDQQALPDNIVVFDYDDPNTQCKSIDCA
jgi:hypothetical protein